MTHLRRRLSVCLLTVCLVVLCGCQERLLDNLLLKKEDPASAQSSSQSEDLPDGPETYLSSYRNLSFTLPEGWKVTHDQVSQINLSSSGGASVSIAFSEGSARIALLQFPASGEDTAQLLETDGFPAGSYTMLEEEYFVFSEGRANEANFYHVLVQNQEGGYRLYAGVRTDTEAYQFLALVPAGADAELDAATGIFNSIDFLDNESLTTAFASGMSSDPPDSDLAETPEDANAITVTCVSPVNVRTAPNSHDSQIIGSLSTGDVIKVTGEDGGWYQFEYEGQTAYAYKKYFQ